MQQSTHAVKLHCDAPESSGKGVMKGGACSKVSSPTSCGGGMWGGGCMKGGGCPYMPIQPVGGIITGAQPCSREITPQYTLLVSPILLDT